MPKPIKATAAAPKPGLPLKNAVQFPSQSVAATVQRRNIMNKVERAFKPHWR